MARYCTNCGARLDGTPRFCGNCGRPCVAANDRPPIRSSGAVRRRSTSSGIWKFFAGTAIGAFFMHLFGGSSHASASNSTNTDTVEHFHDTVIYEDDDDSDYSDYDSEAIGYEEASYCDDEWDTGDNDYGSDSYDDSYDDDWQ